MGYEFEKKKRFLYAAAVDLCCCCCWFLHFAWNFLRETIVVRTTDRARRIISMWDWELFSSLYLSPYSIWQSSHSLIERINENAKRFQLYTQIQSQHHDSCDLITYRCWMVFIVVRCCCYIHFRDCVRLCTERALVCVCMHARLSLSFYLLNRFLLIIHITVSICWTSKVFQMNEKETTNDHDFSRKIARLKEDDHSIFSFVWENFCVF